jgi:hypothetical protein
MSRRNSGKNKKPKTTNMPNRKNTIKQVTSGNENNPVEETSVPPMETLSLTSPKVTNTVTPMGIPSSPRIFNPVNISFFITAVISLAVGCITLFGDQDFKSNDRFLWGVFTLISVALSCFISAIITVATQSLEVSKENKILQKIEALFSKMTDEITRSLNEKTDEITNNVNLIQDTLYSAFELNLVVSSKQDDLVKKLLDKSLKNHGIKSIRIIAHTSDSFYNYFMKYFKNKKKEKEFECTELKVLMHCQDENKKDEVGKNWGAFFKDTKIRTFEVRRTIDLERRSFFGMIIDFERHLHHRIGLLGFYEPKQNEDPENSVISPLKMKYGVISGDNSLLEVLDKNFEHYFNDNARSEQVAGDTNPLQHNEGQ